jgi:hypothetical protein
MNEDIASKIHDIKDIVKIPDNSIFLYYGLIALAFILLIISILLIIKYFRNKKIDHRKEYHSVLKEMSFSSAKTDAYTITKYLRFLARSEREKSLAYELIDELETYKYKKQVEQMDVSIQNKLTTFLDIVDV